MAALIEPALTTVRQDQMEKGRRAAELLFASLQGGTAHEPEEIVLPTTLVVRASTVAPRGK
jgi:LacI family transcriptional regulator